MKKAFAILLLVLALLAISWYWLWPKFAAEKQAMGTPETSMARVEKRDIAFNVEVSGDVTPTYQLDVKAEVGGRITALHVVPGQTVKEGDPLAEIDDRDLKTEKERALTEIAGANLSMDRTRKNFERAHELFEAKLISQEVFDNLSAEYEIAKNTLRKADQLMRTVEDKLVKTKVIAAINGTVLTVPVIEGQVAIAAASVNSGTTLMTIADLSRLRVEVQVNQVDVSQLSLNQIVKLRAESLKDGEMEASISFIAPVATVKNAVKGFAVQATIDHPDTRLRPGMTVNLTVPIANAKDAVSVPISAVFRGEGSARVVYVKNGDATEKREVKLGVTNLDFAQILDGVNEGDEILLTEPNILTKKS